MKRFPAATFFHTAAWARVLHECYAHEPMYFAAHVRGSVGALLPVMEVNSWLTGRRGVSLPFTDECTPCQSDPTTFHQLFEHVLACARSRSWRYFECRGGYSQFKDAPASTSFYRHIVHLAADERELAARFESSVRRGIRKAGKSGLTAEVSTTVEATQAFYSLHCETRRGHGVPPQPWRFFRAIQRHVLATGNGFVMLARFEDRPIAGAVFFHHAKEAIYKFGASLGSFQHLRPNNLVMWEAIRHLVRGGFDRLNLGRTSLSNAGLRRFKLGWGSVEDKMGYVRFDLRRDRFVPVRDGAEGWHNRLIRHLPTVLSRAAGAVLYPHLS